MDFFERQAKAQATTRRLIVYLVAAIIALIVAVYLVAAVLFLQPAPGLMTLSTGVWLTPQPLPWFPPAIAPWIHLPLLGGVAGTTLVIIGAGMLLKRFQLRKGGASVAETLDGRLVPPNTTDPGLRRLLNVVEEMAIASGVPVPAVYILENEEVINAFAAGFTPQDAVIAVTRGTVEQLSRDELQGVIGHEFSHLLNGDMRLSTRLISLAAGILALTLVGRAIFRAFGRTRSSSSDKRSQGGLVGLVLLGLALIIIGSVGAFFARLIKAAVSRQREFLADAASVQFTRNPEGLAGALLKISEATQGSRLHAANAEEASHLYFSDGVSHFFGRWLSTHPPIVDRLHAILPDAELAFDRPAHAEAAEPQSAIDEALGHFAAPGTHAPTFHQTQETATEEGEAEIASILPAPWPALLREPAGAAAGVLALLISSQPEVAHAQQALVNDRAPVAVQEAFNRLRAEAAPLPPDLRLPVALRAIPALRNLSRDQFTQWQNLLHDLMAADGQTELFEYALQRIVQSSLEPFFFPRKHPANVGTKQLQPLVPECVVVLSALAYVGADSSEEAARCFSVGARVLDSGSLQMLPPPDCDLTRIDNALPALSQLNPLAKKQFLEACLEAVRCDAKLTTAEAELVRAVAAVIGAGLPAGFENALEAARSFPLKKA